MEHPEHLAYNFRTVFIEIGPKQDTKGDGKNETNGEFGFSKCVLSAVSLS